MHVFATIKPDQLLEHGNKLYDEALAAAPRA
jgi:hypothetical protein